jgi:hypothetical protein
MTKEQARQILATGQGDVVTANQVYYGTPGAPSQTTSPTATPAGPPTGYAPGQALSADPNVFTASSYIEGLNLSTYQQQANAENTRRYDNYLNQFKNWQMNGSQGQPPAAPQYETVDLAGFQKWWTQYQANIASGNGSAPDTGMFLANAPMYGNGYFGFPGTSQVGTLYNPTGPPTPAQLQAAQSAQNGNLNS